MKTYIAFLRGINVSGNKKIPMAELRTLCDGLHFKNVKTYIQSGNVVFESENSEIVELEKLFSQSILHHFRFEVPVIVKTIEQLQKVITGNPYNSEEEIAKNKIYFVLLNGTPTKEVLVNLRTENYINEEFTIAENCIYLKCKAGYGKAKLNNNLIERKLGVLATTRNYRTINKMLELST